MFEVELLLVALAVFAEGKVDQLAQPKAFSSCLGTGHLLPVAVFLVAGLVVEFVGGVGDVLLGGLMVDVSVAVQGGLFVVPERIGPLRVVVLLEELLDELQFVDVFVVVGAHGQFGVVGLRLPPGLDLGQHRSIIYVKNSIEISCNCNR